MLRCLSVLHIINRSGLKSYPAIYAVGNNPERGLLDRNISEGHLQSSKERIKIKQGKNDENKSNKPKQNETTTRNNR